MFAVYNVLLISMVLGFLFNLLNSMAGGVFLCWFDHKFVLQQLYFRRGFVFIGGMGLQNWKGFLHPTPIPVGSFSSGLCAVHFKVMLLLLYRRRCCCHIKYCCCIFVSVELLLYFPYTPPPPPPPPPVVMEFSHGLC